MVEGGRREEEEKEEEEECGPGRMRVLVGGGAGWETIPSLVPCFFYSRPLFVRSVSECWKLGLDELEGRRVE